VLWRSDEKSFYGDESAAPVAMRASVIHVDVDTANALSFAKLFDHQKSQYLE